MGEYKKAKDEIKKQFPSLNTDYERSHYHSSLGLILYFLKDFVSAKDELEKAVYFQQRDSENQIYWAEIWYKTHLYLTYKKLGIQYDKDEIYNLYNPNVTDYELEYHLYVILDDKSFLKNAYNRVQKLLTILDEHGGNRYINYDVPKAILEEYNKIFKERI